MTPFRKLTTFHTCNKTCRISSCLRFLSKHFVTAFLGELHRTNYLAVSRPQLSYMPVCWLSHTDRLRVPRLLPHLQCQMPVKPWHWKRTAQAFLKRVRSRMEYILFQFLFMCVCAMNHLKEQQIFCTTEKCWLRVLVLLALFVTILVSLYWQTVWKYFVVSVFPFLIQWAANTVCWLQRSFSYSFYTGSYWKQNWDPFSLNIYR